MELPVIALLHSPLTGRASWGRLDEQLGAAGYQVVVPDVEDDNRAPFAVRYVASVGRAIGEVYDENARPPLVLVGHSATGPLLPSIGAAQRAAGRRLGGYVFCDADLPMRNLTRLELLDAAQPGLGSQLGGFLETGGLYPDWTFEELAGAVPDPDDRRELLADLRPRGLGFFTEVIPMPDDWPDAPCGFLQTSSAYAGAARSAGQRGWPVRVHGESHFLALTDPAKVAGALEELLGAL